MLGFLVVAAALVAHPALGKPNCFYFCDNVPNINYGQPGIGQPATNAYNLPGIGQPVNSAYNLPGLHQPTNNAYNLPIKSFHSNPIEIQQPAINYNPYRQPTYRQPLGNYVQHSLPLENPDAEGVGTSGLSHLGDATFFHHEASSSSNSKTQYLNYPILGQVPRQAPPKYTNPCIDPCL